jgi:hypothetical protein
VHAWVGLAEITRAAWLHDASCDDEWEDVLELLLEDGLRLPGPASSEGTRELRAAVARVARVEARAWR